LLWRLLVVEVMRGGGEGVGGGGVLLVVVMVLVVLMGGGKRKGKELVVQLREAAEDGGEHVDEAEGRVLVQALGLSSWWCIGGGGWLIG
jgi:hypothetical protein